MLDGTQNLIAFGCYSSFILKSPQVQALIHFLSVSILEAPQDNDVMAN